MTGGGLGAQPWAWLAAVAMVFALAGCIKGVVGLGLPTVSMALLALLVVPAEAAALLIVPSLVTNLWQLRPFAALGPLLRRLGGMQLGICAGTWLGAWLLGAPAGAWSRAMLGMALIAYGVWGLMGARLSVPARAEAWLSPWVGLITGWVTAATGVFVVPAVPYLQALGLHRDTLVQAMGLCFTVSTLALAGGLAFNASYPLPTPGGLDGGRCAGLAGLCIWVTSAGKALRASLGGWLPTGTQAGPGHTGLAALSSTHSAALARVAAT